MRIFLREFKNVARELRAQYLIYFKPEYVSAQMKKRRGGCGQHGCCGISIFAKFRKCLKGKECLKWSNLPKRCYLYPIDEEDKAIGTEKYCNFYWSEEPTYRGK